MDLLELLRRPEGKTLEYKRDLSSPDGALRTLVAFANTAGGVLAIGVEDGTRRVRGVPDVLAVEERLANLVADTILPRLIPDIEIVPWRKTYVLVAQVYPSQARPHYLTRLGPDEGVFIRIGSTNRRADAAQVQEMRRFSDLGSFDERPLPNLNRDTLDFRAASEIFAHVRKITPSAFRTLKVTTTYQSHEVPTIGGYLLFAKDRFDHFPDAWIQAGRFAGTDRSKLIDRAEIRSYLPRAAEDAIEFVQKHLTNRALIETARRVDRWSVPLVALREATINAIVHADYAEQGAPIRVAIFDDRIEVENPGTLPLGLTIEDIQKGVSKLRNRVIGRIFHELGLTEQWGSGIQRMTAACLEAGLPAPVLEEIGSRFRVVLGTVPSGPPTIDSKDRGILDLLSDGKGRSTAQIARLRKLSTRATRSRLEKLVERGLLVEVGSGPTDPHKTYTTSKR